MHNACGTHHLNVLSLLLHQGVTATKIERARILGNIDLASACAQADEKGKEYFLSALPENLDNLEEQWAITILCLLLVNSPGTEASTQNPPNQRYESGLNPNVSFTSKLRGEQPNAKELRQEEDPRSLAGLRNTVEAIARLPGHVDLGRILADFFRKVLREVPHLRQLLVSLGSGLIPEDGISEASTKLDTLLVPVRLKSC